MFRLSSLNVGRSVLSSIDRGLDLQGTHEEEDRPFEEYLVGSKVHGKIGRSWGPERDVSDHKGILFF